MERGVLVRAPSFFIIIPYPTADKVAIRKLPGRVSNSFCRLSSFFIIFAVDSVKLPTTFTVYD